MASHSVFLPEKKFHEQEEPVGLQSLGPQKLDMSEQLRTHTHTHTHTGSGRPKVLNRSKNTGTM